MGGCSNKNEAPPVEQEHPSGECIILKDQKFDQACDWTPITLVMEHPQNNTPPLPEYSSQIPQPYGQMCFHVQEAITNGDEAEADRLAQECITLAEAQDEHLDMICNLNAILGRMLLEAEMYDSARRYATELAKHGGSGVYLLARCMALSGDVDGGFMLILDEIDRSPLFTTILLQATGMLLRQVKPSETMFEKIDSLMNRVEIDESIDPKMITKTIGALINYWTIRDNPERLIPLYEKALTRDDLDYTQSLVIPSNLAWLYSEVLGQHQKALEIIDHALSRDKENIDLLNLRGFILINTGNPSDAIPTLIYAVELSNQHPSVRINLAYAWHLAGQTDRASHEFNAVRSQLSPHAHKMHKEYKAIYDTLAAAYPSM